MRHKLFTASLLAATLTAFVIGGAAQKSQQNPQDQTTQGQTKPGMMDGGMMGQGMMVGGMMGMMGQMTTHHQQMSTLMNNLMQSMAAIRNEKDPEALKSKLAEHQTLLDQMRTQMMQQGNRMQMMSGQIKQNCPAASEPVKPPTK